MVQTEIFNGRKSADKILSDLKKKIKKLKTKPSLAIILVGRDASSKLYIKLKKKAAKKIGIKVKEIRFKESAKEENIIRKITFLNGDKNINGIIVQLPLPKGFDVNKIVSSIDPKKDVDGFHYENRALLKETSKPYFFPVLPMAIFFTLKQATGKIKKKNIEAVVNSDFFGKNLQIFFKTKGIHLNYILRKKEKIVARTKRADIIISVCGCPNLIKGDMVKEGVIIIDGGITRLNKKKVVGDINRKSLEGKASFLTPVPGGIGPITVAMLLNNVYLSKRK